MAWVECVPNFSEGRRPDVIAAIAAAVPSEGAHLLDVNSDHDHNRMVLTIAGEPDAVLEAMLRAAAVAVELIDLDQHQGVHPRVGAVDVVPFVPLRDCTLHDCVQLARAFGERAARDLDIPVYLYEAAALRPERRNLADVRRGGYEALKVSIERDPARMPDFGPARISRAGAMIVGARMPLIAFNAYLNTDEVEVAQAVARAIRGSSGGLPTLKALGMLVKGQAQVSMNITDYRVTSLYSVMQALNAAAAEHDAQVTHTELIGLIPQAALLDYAVESLRLEPSARTRTIEHQIGLVTGDFRELSFE